MARRTKARLGANAILGVSLAVAKAAAAANKPAALSLRRRHRGAHSAGADDEHPQWRRTRRQPIDFQEFMIDAARRVDVLAEALRMGVEIFQTLKNALQEAGHNTNVGDEGGFAPNLLAPKTRSTSSRSRREGRLQARRGCRSRARSAPRPSSSRTARTSTRARRKTRSIDEQVQYLADWCGEYPIVSIEDGMAEDDFEGWKELHRPHRQEDASWSATTCSSPT